MTPEENPRRAFYTLAGSCPRRKNTQAAPADVPISGIISPIITVFMPIQITPFFPVSILPTVIFKNNSSVVTAECPESRLSPSYVHSCNPLEAFILESIHHCSLFLEALHILQCAQFPPQQDFPCFLSLIMETMIPATIRIIKSAMHTVPKFDIIHVTISPDFLSSNHPIDFIQIFS